MRYPETANTDERFSLVVGGPFHRTLCRLGLTGADQLPTQRAALVLALVAWLLPALLVVGQSFLDDHYTGWEFFSDWIVHTRYLLAIWMMVATERYADDRLSTLAQNFSAANILSHADQPRFKSALINADRRSGSTLAELVILAAVLVWSSFTAHYAVDLGAESWVGTDIAGKSVLSWAGEAARFISTPLFLFLVFRWIWRFLVWSGLLYRISRLSLHLTPLHPDRSAGLGFLANFPGIFSGFVFSLSCVVAAAMVNAIGLGEHSSQTIWFAIAGWLVMLIGLVLGPLLVFVPSLYALRERALIDYGRLASQHHFAFHRKWILENRNGEELLGSPDPSSTADLSATVQFVQQQRFIPVDFPAVFQLVIAAGVPMLAVIVTQVPLTDLVKWIFGTIF